MPENLFVDASRHQLKGRIVLDGPTGAGKTKTALTMARELAGPDGTVAVIDTERRSSELYSDEFAFKVLNWVPPYDPRKLAKVLRDHDGMFDVMILDSGTHFWKGEGGTLDIVEAAGARSGGNNFAGWNQGTPALRSMIDTMLGMECHFIMCLRSKMDHVLETNAQGKQVPVQVGMAPEMRADINYEFTLAVSMDRSHQGVVTKSRCSTLADKIIRPGENFVVESMDVFRTWLEEGAPPPDLVDEDYRLMLIKWMNALQPKMRGELRELWPIGVPEIRSDELTADQALRVERLLGSFMAAPTEQGTLDEVANDGEGGETDPPAAPAKKAPAKKAAAKKAPAKKAPAKKAAAPAAPPADQSEAPADDEVQPDADGEAAPDEAPASDEQAADDQGGGDAPADTPEAAEGDTAPDAAPADEGEPVEGEPIDWKAVADDLKLGRATALNAARDLAAERGIPQPPGLAKVPTDLDFQQDLMVRLEALAAAEAQRGDS